MDTFDIRKWRNKMLIEAAERAEKDYDGDGKIESPEEEYLGSKDKAIKASMKNEAPEGMYYIEVSVRDARKALEILDDMYRKQFQTSGSNVYYFSDESTAYDAMMDFGVHNIEIIDTNIEEELNEAEEDDPQEIKIGSYQTKYFDMCPGATAVYKDIEDKVEDMDMAERAAKLQDALFYIEKHILEDQEQGTDEGYITVAENLADQIMAMARMMDLEQEHSYIQSHVDTIKKALKGEDTESTADQLAEGTCSCGCGGCGEA